MYRSAESGVQTGVRNGVSAGVSVVVASAVIQGLNSAGRGAKSVVTSKLTSMRQERHDALVQQVQIIFDMMASATSDKDEFIDEMVIEYQRKIPMKGFKSDHLFLNEAKFRCCKVMRIFCTTAMSLTQVPMAAMAVILAPNSTPSLASRRRRPVGPGSATGSRSLRPLLTRMRWRSRAARTKRAGATRSISAPSGSPAAARCTLCATVLGDGGAHGRKQRPRVLLRATCSAPSPVPFAAAVVTAAVSESV
jgi:hypothetical protein